MIVVSWADHGKRHLVVSTSDHTKAMTENHKTVCGLRVRRITGSASYGDDVAKVDCKRCARYLANHQGAQEVIEVA